MTSVFEKYLSNTPKYANQIQIQIFHLLGFQIQIQIQIFAYLNTNTNTYLTPALDCLSPHSLTKQRKCQCTVIVLFHNYAPEALCFRVVCPSVHLCVRPSIHPKPEIPSFHLYTGSVGPSDQPWPFYGMSVHPPVRGGFRAFARERIEGMVWNFACWCILTTFITD